MKKLILLAISILILTLVLVGCTQNGETETTTASEIGTTAAADTTDAQTNADNQTATTAEEVTTPEDATTAEEVTTVDMNSLAARETAVIDKNLTVVGESDGTSQIKTPTGLEYSATGFKTHKSGKFVVSDKLTITFAEGQLTEKYNRFRMGYSSNGPFKFTLTYIQDGKEKTDLLYGEAGDDLFCALIPNFTAGGYGEQITSVVIEPCEDKDLTFSLCSLDLQEIEPYLAKMYYIEGTRFKLGYSLKKGGAICYIQDKQCPIDSVENLINMHDAGRLVQQSYYGTGKTDTYDPGAIGNEEWMYNPVQGGDGRNHSSRIIDIVVRNSSVYLKVQPLDWGGDKQYTPSYMENVYAITDEYIKVDNRFVDFMGVEHPTSSQELPAFYTINYFDEFVCYSGDASWTDDKLYRNDDIEFLWTATEHTYPISVYMKLLNTETWCALVNADDNYGIGMYTPNADRLAGGDYVPNKSKSGTDNSCSYMSAACHIKMVSYHPIEYSYLIATGSVEEIRATFKQNKDFATNESLHDNYTSVRITGSAIDMTDIDFTDPLSVYVFSEERNMAYEYDSEEKAMKLISTPNPTVDPYTYFDYRHIDNRIEVEDYSKITIEYMIPEDCSGQTESGCEFFLCTGDTEYAEGGKSYKVNSFIRDGQYHTLEVDISGCACWTGTLNQIRFDFFNLSVDGDVMYIKSFKLSN